MFSGTNYLVRAGDSIAKIAKQTGVSVKAIIDANRNLVPMKIKVGQMLVIPQPMGTNSPSMPDAAGAGN
jgi:LysM repeat protein